MESSKDGYDRQDEGGGSSEAERHCAYCNRPIRHGQTYYYCRLCGRGPLCNNHFHGDDGCAFCKPRKGFPKWGIALIALAVVAIWVGVWYLTNPPPPHPPPIYSLTTDVSPSGSGSITLSPSGGSYEAGDMVSLTAHANSGYQFDYWGGDASGSSNPTSIETDGDKYVVARFRKSSTPAPAPITCYSLTTSVTPSGSGNVSPSSGTYDAGSTVRLTAQANSGYQFDYWGGDPSGSSNPTSITMDGNKHVVAHFRQSETPPQIHYTLTTSVTPSGSGSISPSGDTYDSGATVTLRASPASGYQFSYWSGDASGTSSTVTITVDGDKHVMACFTPLSQRIELHMGGAVAGFSTYKIRFSQYLNSGQEVTGSVEWYKKWVYGWSFDVLDPESNIMVIDESGPDPEHWNFRFVASHAGEYTIKMTNEGDVYGNEGVMETRPPGWRQTEY